MRYGSASRILTVVAIIISVFMLFACGGGGGGGGSSSAPAVTSTAGIQSVSGVAATGAPLSGNIYLKTADGTILGPQKIASDGSYSFDVTGMTPPFIIFAQEIDAAGNTTGRTLYSVSFGAGTANVNPLTNLLLALASGAPEDPSVFYSDPQSNPIDSSTVNSLLANIRSMLNALLTHQNYNAANVNPLNDPFSANHQGLDKVFDDTKVTLLGGIVSTDLFGVEIGRTQVNGWIPIDAIQASEINPSSSGASVTGNGTAGIFSAVLNVVNADSVNNTGLIIYSFQGMSLQSTSIAGVVKSGSDVTITGTANGTGFDRLAFANYTFEVVITEGAPDAIAIEINRADGSLFFSASSLEINPGGDFDTGGSVINGNGMNEPFMESMNVNADSGDLASGVLSYSFQRMALASTAITAVTLIGTDMVVVEGTTAGVDLQRNAIAGYSFIATIMDGNPDSMGIEVNRPDGSLYFSTFPKGIEPGGNFTVTAGAPI